MVKPDIDQLLGDIRERVAQRREAGDYPPGLEQQLEAEFRGLVDRERRHWYATADRLTQQMAVVSTAYSRVNGVTDTVSRLPFGSLFHRFVQKIIGRQVRGLAGQISVASTEMVTLIGLVTQLQLAQEDADRRLVAHLAKTTLSHLAVVDHLAILVTDIERRLDEMSPR